MNRPLLRRSLLALLAVFGLAVVLQQLQRRRALAEIGRVHDYRAVLIGDSHGDDIPWDGRPRLTNPAQDLYTALKYLEAIDESQRPDSRLETVVLTIWPHKFGPLATRRLSGLPQKDGWDVQALGKVAPLFSWSDLWRSEAPWRFRLRSALHVLQLKVIHLRFDQNCFEQSVKPDYRKGHGYDFNDTFWWPESAGTQAIFAQFADRVEAAGRELIVVENPLHWHYLAQIDSASFASYNDFLAGFDARPHVTVLSLGRDSVDFTHFRDWQHLTCKGEQYVWERLEPLLPGTP